MSRNANILVMVVLATICIVTSESGDSGFQRYECYRDLCVSRRQYCSDRERRCKLCQPAHCINRDLTPTQCVPLCPEFLAQSSTTTTAATTTTVNTATTSPSPTRYDSTAKPASDQRTSESANIDSMEKFVTEPTNASQLEGVFGLSPGAIVAFGVIAAILLVLMVLVVAIVCRLKAKREASTNEKQRRGKDEEEAFLNFGWDSKTGSHATLSSHTSKSPPPGQSQPPAGQARPRNTDLESVLSSAECSTLSGDIHHCRSPPYTARTGSQLQGLDECREGIAPASTDEASPAYHYIPNERAGVSAYLMAMCRNDYPRGTQSMQQQVSQPNSLEHEPEETYLKSV